jgi:hypothetical protein
VESIDAQIHATRLTCFEWLLSVSQKRALSGSSIDVVLSYAAAPKSKPLVR